jgi:FtsP/CotA-like multicopper oxidase with cupredoxin domain
LIDPELGAGEDNEIWPGFDTDENGTGYARVEVDHVVRGDAQSVVVHDPDSGNKILCANLVADDEGDVTFEGAFATFAAAEAVDDDASGSATLTRGPSGTTVTVSVTGLDPSATYSSHVHSMPCAVMEANGHYLRDPAVAAGEDNELWPPIALEPDSGVLDSTLVVADHVARADAQSVVIHRDGAKVLCADLGREWPARVTEGDAVELDGATDQGVDGLSASATMMRELDGTTTVLLEASGLLADTMYPAHVHNMPCSISDGGSHYKLDDTVADALPENEIWLDLMTDAAGDATSEVTIGHTPRPEAQAVVIHGEGGVRLACIDLE